MELRSPDGRVMIRFDLNNAGQPYYLLSFGDSLVLDTSLLGLQLNQAPDLKAGFEITSFTGSSFDETWEQPWGEEQHIRNHYNELVIALQETESPGRKVDIVFRAFDYGVGFRYVFPEQDSLKDFEVREELTEFHFTGDPTAWWIPALEFNRYEYLYRETPLSEMGKVHTPVTFRTEKGIYVSLHEAALKDYTSMIIDGTGGPRLRTELICYRPDGETKAFVHAPGATPWRTIQLAEKPGDLITSYLILNLNEPNALGDVSWFKPGKYVGIWWELHIDKGTWASGPKHAATTARTKEFIDFAAAHGFDGVLVEGWNTGWEQDWFGKGGFSYTEAYPDYDIEEVADYARSKGVYIVGHHETGSDVDGYEAELEAAFQQLGDLGMKAVKTGYVEHGNVLTNGKCHHGQAFVEHHFNVIRTAAQHRVAVVEHEPIKDTGERRTYPNMISREGARGQEFNAWGENGGNPPNHTTLLPFTRCLAGPMDFTPGVFNITIPEKPDNQVNTTLAKQLALYVVIYAPMQMACDLPENYLKYPDAFEWIKNVGVDWETTKVLAAEIGRHVTIARKERGTGNWFVGGITNEEPRDMGFVLDFLDAGQTYRATLYKDGPNAHYRDNPEDYTIEELTLSADDTIAVHLAASGGFALSLIRE